MNERRCYGCMHLLKDERICPVCGFDQRTTNETHQLPAGTILQDQYLLGRVLGQGGFGITYLGWDLYLDIPVAIKEYYPAGVVMRESSISMEVLSYTDDDGVRFRRNKERFLREAKMLARFSQIPQIVQIRNFFLANNTAYIVMEYVEGVTLRDYVKSHGGTLAPTQTLELVKPVIQALCKVHKIGLIHRDISPDNLMLLPDGGVKLLDFGAVRDVSEASVDKQLSRSTEAILKQGYAPIEQYQKRGSLGPWTDVYALCATLYYCMTGEVPPDAPERLLYDEELELQKKIPTLSGAQVLAIEHGMQLRAENRTKSMDELYEELYKQPSVTQVLTPLSPEVINKPDPAPEPEPEPDPEPEPKPEPKPEPEPESELESEPATVITPKARRKMKLVVRPKTQTQPKIDPEPEHKTVVKPEPVPDPEPEHTMVVKPEPAPDPEPEHKTVVKPEPAPDPEPEHKTVVKPEPAPDPEPEHKTAVKPEPEPEHKTTVQPETVEEPEPPAEEEAKAEERPEKKRPSKKARRQDWWMLSVFAVLVVAIIAVSGVLIFSGKPSGAEQADETLGSSAQTAEQEDRTPLVSGDCSRADWVLYDNGDLIFTPRNATEAANHTGMIAAYDEGEATPWGDYAGFIKTLRIEEGISSIGANAFAGLHKLETVTLPDSMQSVSAGAFSDTPSLREVTLGPNVAPVDYPFGTSAELTIRGYENTAAEDAARTAGQNFEQIGACQWDAQGQCGDTLYWYYHEGSGLLRIDGDNDMWDFRTKAKTDSDRESAPWTQYASSIRILSIGNGVRSIGEYAFFNMRNLNSAYLGSGLTSIGKGAFVNCGMASLTLPEGVTELAAYSVRDCYALRSICLPESLTTLERDTFYMCSALEKLYVGTNTQVQPQTVLGTNDTPCVVGARGSDAERFAEEVGYRFVVGLDGQEADAEGQCGDTVYWAIFGDDLVLYGTGETWLFNIGDNEMRDYPSDQVYSGKPGFGQLRNSFAHVRILPGVTRLQCRLFTGLTIESVDLGEIAYAADIFANCRGLKEVTLPQTMTQIGANLFYECSDLEKVTILGGSDCVEENVFYGCENLREVWFSGEEHITGDLGLRTDMEEKPLTFHVLHGSEAYTYAAKNGIRYQLITDRDPLITGEGDGA